jgi:hypothetical protein
MVFDANIIQLPYGLVLKWIDRTSMEEAAEFASNRQDTYTAGTMATIASVLKDCTKYFTDLLSQGNIVRFETEVSL